MKSALINGLSEEGRGTYACSAVIVYVNVPMIAASLSLSRGRDCEESETMEPSPDGESQ